MTWFEVSANSLSAYPRWFVVTCATIATAVLLWILAKVLKWSLYVIVILVLIAAVGLAFSFLFT